MNKIRAAITGIHGWVPEYVLTNEELAKMKAEKAAAPQESPEGTKKKKEEKAPAEGKEKKKK